MIKVRNSMEVLNLPVWVLILFVLIARRKRERSLDDMANRRIITNDLRYSLPLPRTGLERRLVGVVMNWIDREEHDLRALEWLFTAASVKNN